MFPAYRTRLLSDLETWTADGLITADAAAAIAARYPARGDGVKVALIYLAVILLSAGLIALVASNWQEIPRLVRVGGLLGLNLSVLALCAFFSQRRPAGSIVIEALAALSIVSAAASISLVGQMYHFPGNWPAFSRSMVVVALATAMVARSTASLWLCAAALGSFVQSLATEYGWNGRTGAIGWGPHALEIASYCMVLIGISLSPWTRRVGAWTLLAVLLPGLWWVAMGSTLQLLSPVPMPLLAVAMLLLVHLGPHGLSPQRLRDALSALVGALLIAIVAFAADNGAAGRTGGLHLPAAMAVGLIAAALLLFGLRLNLTLWSEPRLWLALSLMACCGIGFYLPLQGNLAVLSWLVPLSGLAVEARLSDRSKTFGAVVVVFLGLIVVQMGVVKDLRSLAAALLAGGVVAVAILMAVRKSANAAVGEVAR